MVLLDYSINLLPGPRLLTLRKASLISFRKFIAVDWAQGVVGDTAKEDQLLNCCALTGYVSVVLKWRCRICRSGGGGSNGGQLGLLETFFGIC